jgi:hypothetical protein
MKKIIFALGFILATSVTLMAQDISKNAIGLRLGDNDGFGGEISYQRALGSNNRLEIDLGLRNNNSYDGFKATAIYQWVWNIDGGFNWYAGFGGGLGSYSGKNNNDFSETFVFAAGNIGIEYNFPSAPFLISLDLRPEFGFGNTFNDYGSDIALGIRYQF